ncbi:MAG TPA: phosphate transport system regulatory protein PhoU [Desulfovibrio sp.]|nr:phosphate transport system regulatory protein PhoU [Desulfovibrio sp.]
MAPAKNLTTDRLDALRHKLLAMLATVEQAIDSCIEAYCQRDEARAWTVASHDHAINEMETCIDEMGMRLLAREGPLAQDLRTVLATMRIANDIERMADEAANIAERTMPLVALPPLPFDDDFKAYVPLVRNMVHQAVQCVVDMDADLARSLAELDEGVDCGLRQITLKVVQYMKANPDRMEAALSFLIICRRLERIGDLSTNIGESVYFAVRGVNAKHSHFEEDEQA